MGFDMGGEDQDAGFGKLLADHASGVQAFDGVRGGHPDVDDDDVRDVLPNQGGELGRVPGLTHHLVAGAFQQAGQPLAEEDVVVGQNHPPHAHGAHRGRTGGA